MDNHSPDAGSETEPGNIEIPLSGRRAGLVQCGPFELRLDTGELRKDGQKVKLQGKSFLILKALLERPGEVVTREELRQRLWPADTFVDFESGLNTAANRLRLTLGDSAERPRFIQTLARTGYRFIAPVSVISPAVDDVSAAPVPAEIGPPVAEAPPAPLIARTNT